MAFKNIFKTNQTSSNDSVAQVVIGGKVIVELPIISPTLGQSAIDVSALGKHGYYTFDDGFLSTASCQSYKTFINAAGQLLYGGYEIDKLADTYDFLDVYLLLNDQLPDPKQSALKDRINAHTMFTSKSTISFAVFAVIATLWPLWWVWLAPYQRFITSL